MIVILEGWVIYRGMRSVTEGNAKISGLGIKRSEMVISDVEEKSDWQKYLAL